MKNKKNKNFLEFFKNKIKKQNNKQFFAPLTLN